MSEQTVEQAATAAFRKHQALVPCADRSTFLAGWKAAYHHIAEDVLKSSAR